MLLVKNCSEEIEFFSHPVRPHDSTIPILQTNQTAVSHPTLQGEGSASATVAMWQGCQGPCLWIFRWAQIGLDLPADMLSVGEKVNVARGCQLTRKENAPNEKKGRCSAYNVPAVFKKVFVVPAVVGMPLRQILPLLSPRYGTTGTVYCHTGVFGRVRSVEVRT